MQANAITPNKPEIVNERPLTYEKVRYGMLVEVLNDGGYHSGCKVHFFNKKGVLIGNYYQFMPYKKLRLIKSEEYWYPRYFMGNNYLKGRPSRSERLKTWAFIRLCNIVTALIKFTQKYMD